LVAPELRGKGRQMASIKSTMSIKDYMIEIISNQPDDSSFDEILRELFGAREIHLGLADSAEGKVVSSEEVRKRIDSWRK
jgi:methionine synthase II (cobalamin-independent)